MRRSMRLPVLASLALVLAGATWAAGARFGFVHFGHFDRMIQSGDTKGHVRLSDVPQAAGHWGLGALAGLRGEVLLHDGRLLVTRGHDEHGRTEAARPHDEAALYIGAQVKEWADVKVPEDMTQAAFEAFVAQQASRHGLQPEEAFFFLVDGAYSKLVWHVVTGGSAGGHGAGQRAAHAGHANRQSGMRLFEQPGAKGRLIGVRVGADLEGAVTHAGERFHVHYADPELRVSGHVDANAVSRGAVLKLPLR